MPPDKTLRVGSSGSGPEELSKRSAEKLETSTVEEPRSVLEPEAALMKAKHNREHVATRRLERH